MPKRAPVGSGKAYVGVGLRRNMPKGDDRESRGPEKKVRNGKVKDASGEIALVLWGSEVELVVEGDKVRIVEGWVKDYQGKPQISLGRSGKLEKL